MWVIGYGEKYCLKALHGKDTQANIPFLGLHRKPPSNGKIGSRWAWIRHMLGKEMGCKIRDMILLPCKNFGDIANTLHGFINTEMVTHDVEKSI